MNAATCGFFFRFNSISSARASIADGTSRLSDKFYFAAEPTRGMIAPAPMLGNPTLQVICRSNVVST